MIQRRKTWSASASARPRPCDCDARPLSGLNHLISANGFAEKLRAVRLFCPHNVRAEEYSDRATGLAFVRFSKRQVYLKNREAAFAHQQQKKIYECGLGARRFPLKGRS